MCARACEGKKLSEYPNYGFVALSKSTTSVNAEWDHVMWIVCLDSPNESQMAAL